MDLILAKKRVLLLVSGGIAIYKSLDLISALKKEGAEIFVVMSEEATRFIAPLTFEAMSGNKVLCRTTESFPQISHISYANLADIAIIAPATINAIAKLNYGIADNLIVETLLACKCAVFIAPSANINMIESPQNKANLDSLRQMGYKIIPPRRTLLACNVVANGAMAEVSEIIFQLKRAFVLNSSSGVSFALGGNFGEQQTQKSSFIPKISSKYKTSTANTRICDLDSANRAKNAESALDYADSQNLVKKPCHSELSQSESEESKKINKRFVDSSVASLPQNDNDFAESSLDSAILSQSGLPRRFCESARNDEYLDSSLRKCSAQNDKMGENAESPLDSTQKYAEFANFWHNKNIIITGGGSVESIDSIRHISNDSSGKQASNLALAFYYLGASVTLIASKFPLTLPLGVEKIAVKSSADFKNAIETALQKNKEIDKKDASRRSIVDEKSGFCEMSDEDRTLVHQGSELKQSPIYHKKTNAQNILLMAAAISDYVPKQKAQGKLKKEQIGEAWDLHLKQNTDILSEIAKKFGKTTFIVGFKAESELDSASGNAKKMLKNKHCDMVVLNVISEANQIGGERNEVRIFTAQNEIEIPQDSKLNISFAIAKNIAQNLGKKSQKSQNLGTFSHESQNLALNPQNLPTKSTQKK